ncbi:MAG: NUDIX domain-containing protein [bacterium]|nr:NUDIX domain-containing protein [bacterium]
MTETMPIKRDIVMVRGIITNSVGGLLLLRRSDECTNNPGQWEVPSVQLIDYKESITDCIARETNQETGLEVLPTDGKFKTVEVRDKHEGRKSGRYHSLAGLLRIIGSEVVDLSKSSEHTLSMWLPKNEYPRVMLTSTTIKAIRPFNFFE